ncbi:Signal recognition particle [Clydaea vesicula]|uniref:Signal recognition particle 54 kDa protein n=1 Tax=Clydaea vesicula TaxID=447962 RepID=A0AAD5U6Y4_9FUNG|nr:Signal recognition particle [Clydaea vesicula]
MLDEVIKDIQRALFESDVNARLVKKLTENIKKTCKLDEIPSGVNKKKLIQKTIFDELIKMVDPGTEPWKPIKGKVNIVMFVGLQGSGKTTTCTKLAFYYQRKGFKVCLVCTDTFRAGAFDQLKQNATRAKIPFYGSYSETDPVQLAIDGVDKFKSEGFDLIIVDTSGRHKQEAELFAEMKQISDVVQPTNSIFVMDGTIGQAADGQAKAFKSTVDIGSIIITKMDGHAKGGGAISAVAATGSNIMYITFYLPKFNLLFSFIGTGEHIHDLEPFTPKSFIGKMMGMGDISGLIETVKDLNLDQNKNLMENLEKGKFTLRDMREQFQTIQSIGPLSKVMQMMPGIPPEMAQMGDKEGTKKIKTFMCIIDSMTEKELDSDGKLFIQQPTRIHRIAKGSGGTVMDIEEMLKQHKMFAEMVKNLGGAKGMLNQQGKGRDQKNMQMHPNQMKQMQNMQQSMQKMLPPGMMEQMGGMGGMQEMMRSMMGGGGLEGMMEKMGMGGMDLSSLMGGMGASGAGKKAGSSRVKKR